MNPKTTTQGWGAPLRGNAKLADLPENPPTFGGPQKIYISLAIFGVATILLIVLTIFPIFKEIRKESEELLLQKNNLISFSEEIKSLQDSKNLYESYRANLEKIEKLFIDPEIPIEFITFLEKNAIDSHLSIEVSPIAAAKKETELWPSLSFQIGATGSSSNFLKFFEKLENSPYLIEVLNLNLKRAVEREAKEEVLSGNINAVFTIKVFTR